MRISDWSSDVCSSDLPYLYIRTTPRGEVICGGEDEEIADAGERDAKLPGKIRTLSRKLAALLPGIDATPVHGWAGSFGDSPVGTPTIRSEEHTSELQSLMRISYAVFCLKKTKRNKATHNSQ